MNITLTCKICGRKFVFTDGEIQYYKVNELMPPKKCPSCRKNPYADIRKETSKLGYASQDLENNPANHCGFFPVGFQDGYGLKYCMLTVEINDSWYFVRIERRNGNEFVVLFLTSDERATNFPSDFDLEYLLNLVKERGQIKGHEFKLQRYRVQYCPKILGWDEDINTIKKLKHSVNWCDVQLGQSAYIRYWNQNIKKTVLNLENM